MSELSAFSSTERFEVIRVLGRGGMGMVYEVTDLERRSRVALKLLPAAEPAALFAFKQEFRTLADVSHPNLVGLYELFSDQSQTFFTMEVVDGVDLRSFIHGTAQADAAPSDSSAGQNTSRHAAPKADTDANGKPGESESDPTPETPLPIIDDAFLGRLRSALRQLVNGLNVIHSLGFVHRDLKPANIMVEEDGRVVVLDFGLTMDISTRSKRAVQLAGTVAYMSPEQAQSKPLSATSDWYSVGVILYELVTGRFPFKGRWKRVLIARTKEDPDPPHWLNPAVPEDLGLLAAQLLDRNPETRAGADEILSWCGDTVGEGDVPVDAPALPVTSASFIGRTAELQQMHDDFAAARRGETVVTMIRGSSGAGKTALVNHFLASLPADARPFVLTGRCYEQESVPFKAFDSLVDMLTRILEGMRPSTLARLLPRDVASLARIFPVINRVPAVESAPSRTATVPDQVELRRRAFAAIRELLARISDHRPLILLIDDLQWGDVDSAMLFTELLQPPDAPAMLVLGTNRIEDEQRSACLRILNDTAESQIPGVSWRHVTLAPLNHEESLQLAIGILQGTDPRAVSDAVQIADESQGKPIPADRTGSTRARWHSQRRVDGITSRQSDGR